MFLNNNSKLHTHMHKQTCKRNLRYLLQFWLQNTLREASMLALAFTFVKIKFTLDFIITSILYRTRGWYFFENKTSSSYLIKVWFFCYVSNTGWYFFENKTSSSYLIKVWFFCYIQQQQQLHMELMLIDLDLYSSFSLLSNFLL